MVPLQGLLAWPSGPGGGDAEPWEIGQPLASGVAYTVSTPSPLLSFPSPLGFYFLASMTPLSPFLSLPTSLPLSFSLSTLACFSPTPRTSLQTTVWQLLYFPAFSISFPSILGTEGALVGGQAVSGQTPLIS